MKFTDKDRKIARHLMKDPDTMVFLEKLFAPDDGTALSVLGFGSTDLPQNVASLDDERYGRLMKVLYLARQMNKTAIATLKQLGSTRERTGGSVAPR